MTGKHCGAFADYFLKIIFEISQRELLVRVITAPAIDEKLLNYLPGKLANNV